ncbi:hypothetical protein ABH935_004699 [Catenulispora sp. GAS73]|uniref:hypothetical protein n=1 Tax=Catenulispora sp. GAS73 TaxID=3156269 RepID=UPI003512A4EF
MTDTRRRTTLAAVLIALPFAVAACSSSNSSPKNATSGQSTTAPLGQPPAAAAGGKADGKFPAACSLITQDQAKTALGDDVAPGVEQQTAGGNGSTCTFDGAGDADDVILQVGPPAIIHHAQDLAQQTQPVPALGDNAVVYGLTGNIFDIYVVKGTTAIDISISKGGEGSAPATLPPQPVADALTTLAKTALSRF